ncbi:MAG: threonine/serine exporter family protein [Cyclobacteriaceae bacterium]
MPLLLLLLEDAFWSALAATGFAILFNVPVRTLPVCAFSAAVGHMLRTFLMQIGVPIEAASLAGATLVGLMGEYFSHKVQTPASVFTIPGIIPMVPGTFAFKTMMGVIRLTQPEIATEEILLETISNAIKTGIILGSISLGIATTSLLFKKHEK